MKSVIAAIGSCLVGFAAAADGPPAFTCPSAGDWLPWSLTATPYAETPIFAGNGNTKVAAVCNCSQQTSAADGGVWVVTLQPNQPKKGRVFGRPITAPRQDGGNPPPPPIEPGPGQDFYYLAATSCTIVGPGSVMLRTADHRTVKWGAWKLQAGQ